VAVRIVVNRANVRHVLRSPDALAEVTRRARLIAQTADGNTGRPGDHSVDSAVGRNRARAAVYTETFNAMWREADSRTLTRAIDSGR
jgi:hypothetical protein